ncbi:MAG: nickel pincer cofactor biosynthesis protein LarC [Edaphobacter sp.]|uniref:nickel pincer cofactor biosynthesis protein LarC n=1 Tax=Edaphobacter sp. TaxID=1934404 RepID=UPI002394C16D|nr:nickel pincer cofactor biosynthesis protein LarC [Edaphobacter sp.]MDE1175340.1 nickel pincer cofactor biosynthesis protein LarC [Edaphobacter sp.]
MRIAYLDCFAGISGDMFLGALIDAGVEPKILHDAVAALNLGASLKIERVDRSGISCTKIHVLENGELAETAQHHSHDNFQDQRSQEDAGHQHHPKTQHLHKAGHPHTDQDHGHEYTHHDHAHGRSLSVIRSLIQSTTLANPVKDTAIRVFESLGASEAKIHNVDIEKIHFHEVGAVDAIVDIVAASAGIHALKIERWYCSPLNVGGGMVDCAHGRFPVPAPATADLLRGMPTYSAHVQQELVTPTGAAIIRALEPTFGVQPAMQVNQIGYGAGGRNPKDFPNVLRLSIGESSETVQGSVAVLETAIDDLSPQILAYVSERALALGALDVMSSAVQMKKGRLGTLITILAEDSKVTLLEDLLLRETSTLGIRIHHERRSCLERRHVAVATPYGEIRIKIGSRGDEVFNAAPEFEDCRAAATKHSVAVKQVQQAAIAAYLSSGAN